MPSINLKSIKWESIKSIFTSLSNADTLTRAEIAAETGLSLMTVGKIADALLALGVAEQTKQTKTAAGRRAGVLRLTSHNYALILDMSDTAFSLSAVNSRLIQIFETTYAYSDQFTFSENISLFLRQAAAYISANAKKSTCIGVGVSLPVDLTSPIYFTALPEMLKDTFPNMPIYTETSVAAAAASNVYGIGATDGSLRFYCFVANGKVYGALMDGDRIVSGSKKTAGNYGQIALSRGRTLASAIRFDNTSEDNAAEIAKLIHNVTTSVAPDTIVLECEFLCGTDVFIDLVQNKLIEQYGYTPETLPHFTRVPSDFRHAHRGLALHLREDWLYRLIFGNNALPQ